MKDLDELIKRRNDLTNEIQCINAEIKRIKDSNVKSNFEKIISIIEEIQENYFFLELPITVNAECPHCDHSYETDERTIYIEDLKRALRNFNATH